MSNILLQCIYFMLPVYFANMAPVVFKRINFLNIPVDLNNKIGGKPIFGKNKTIRGLLFGVLSAVLVTYLQFAFFNDIFSGLVFLDYENWFLLGILFGVGAVFGDLAESFFKRRLNYYPGKPLVPFDQVDFVVGALIFVYPFYDISLEKILVILVLSLVLHIAVNHLAYYMKIRKEKW